MTEKQHIYPARFAPDSRLGGFQVSFRDLPEALAQGDDEEEAAFMAEDALAAAIDLYLGKRKPLPAPSAPEPGERLITARYHGYDDDEDDDDE